MPYSKKLLHHRKSAGQAACNVRAALREAAKQDMHPQHREWVERVLNEALAVLTATVDYHDNGDLLGIVGQYEEGYPPPCR